MFKLVHRETRFELRIFAQRVKSVGGPVARSCYGAAESRDQSGAFLHKLCAEVYGAAGLSCGDCGAAARQLRKLCDVSRY